MKRWFMTLAACLAAISAWAAETVNINTASVEELAEALNGVGKTKAEAIVRYREANGKFEYVDELVNVKGIGLRTVDRNRDVITLEEGARRRGGDSES